MKRLFDIVSTKCSKLTTTTYSTSFSMGIRLLHRRFHGPIYGIYGFVRFADEIVDSFHDYDKKALLEKFTHDTYQSIEQGISLNPILNSFQEVVNRYGINRELIQKFLNSMEMDLEMQEHETISYKEYIAGSAEAVGLMCLKVFTEGDDKEYEKLRPGAVALGAAFQKINFLRDLKADYEGLNRTYFPGVNLSSFCNGEKLLIEQEIEKDLDCALHSIRLLPKDSKFGVYLAYVYFKALFGRLRSVNAARIMHERIRIPNWEKAYLLAHTYMRHQLNWYN